MAGDDMGIDNLGRVMRLAKAVDHRIRIEIILAHANGGAASATNLAEAGLDSLGNVAYHRSMLRDLGVFSGARSDELH